MFALMLLSGALLSAPVQTPTPTAKNVAQDAPAVLLRRTFVKGQACTYNVFGEINAQNRGLIDPESNLRQDTWIPLTTDISYRFYTKTLNVEGGNARMKYVRPEITETSDDPETGVPKADVTKLNELVYLTVSPINEVLDVKDMTPKQKPDSGSSSDVMAPLHELALGHFSAVHLQGIQDVFGSFVGDVQRLSLFIGPIDASMDLSPRLSLEPKKVGESWERTVSYQPQKSTATGGKTEVQRLDMKLTYLGMGTWNKKPVRKVGATIHLDTDLAKYVNDTYNVSASVTHLKTIPLTLDLNITFDLDPKTNQTLYASLQSTSAFSISVTDFETPVIEEKSTGNTAMRLVNSVIEPVSAKEAGM